jgi:hypothetical protein
LKFSKKLTFPEKISILKIMDITMNFDNVKMELIFPVFFGCLGALILCMLVSVQRPVLVSPAAAEELAVENAVAEEPPVEEAFQFYTGVAGVNQTEDPVREPYNNMEIRPQVIDFFADICGSREIAEAILANAESFDIPAALAFALCWEESRFKPQAVNYKNRDGSIDRGLFQLNNRSFPALDSGDFFNVNTNVRYGLSHLRFCLNTGGSEIAALAMYNAGTGKVNNTGAPKVTLDYIHRILENRSKIEEHFHARVREDVFPESIAKAESGPPRFKNLSPLALPAMGR